jgi:hypothetical protein
MLHSAGLVCRRLVARRPGIARLLVSEGAPRARIERQFTPPLRCTQLG